MGILLKYKFNTDEKLQKSAARIILSATFTTSSQIILFDKLDWDTPSQRIYKKRMYFPRGHVTL